LDFFQELKDLAATLEAHAIDYALCGGVALAIHGAPRATQDPVRRGLLHVVSRDGLISLKLSAGRPQDIADIKRLEEVGRG
jgi:hypothetical protein